MGVPAFALSQRFGAVLYVEAKLGGKEIDVQDRTSDCARIWVETLGDLQRVTLMLSTYTAKYTKIDSGYLGQLIEWPEVVTEGESLEDCRNMLQDALEQMVAAYRDLGREVPVGGALIEQMPIEV